MRRIIKSITLLAIMAIALPSFGQGLKAFKLKNGLSVYVWEDNTKSDVYGIVACRTGSVNDPAEYTGLAHYLEHVMFKGTDKIGALDWATEKPIYDKIIAKYDEMADEADPVKKEAIAKEINAKIHIKKGIYYHESCKKGIILCHFIKKQRFTQVIKPKWSLPMPTNSISYLLEKIE